MAATGTAALMCFQVWGSSTSTGLRLEGGSGCERMGCVSPDSAQGWQLAETGPEALECVCVEVKCVSRLKIR